MKANRLASGIFLILGTILSLIISIDTICDYNVPLCLDRG